MTRLDSLQGSLVGALRHTEPDELEAGLNALIERRARQGESDPEESEPSYQESVRQYHARRQDALRWEWIRYFERLSDSFRQRSEECARKAAALDPGERRV